MKGADMPQVIAAWIERFATRALQLEPDRRPLDAVREAISMFDEGSDLAPEVAAEIHVQRQAAVPRGDMHEQQRSSA
jgi:hypothetical protein